MTDSFTINNHPSLYYFNPFYIFKFRNVKSLRRKKSVSIRTFNVVLFLLNLYTVECTENCSNCPFSPSWCTEPPLPFLRYQTLSYFSKWCMKVLIITCDHYFRPVFSTFYVFYLMRNSKTQLFLTDYLNTST